jgi:nucleoside-diphosphate-sugar epimerase
VHRLRSLEHEVVEVNRQSGDISSQEIWATFPPTDVVVHLAARTFVPDSWSDPGGFVRTNFHGTMCALDYCRIQKAKMIFLSAYLYGIPDALPISESAALRANNPYALSKKLAEDACKFYSYYYGIDITVLRPFNTYGPGQTQKWLIPSIVEQVRKSKVIEVMDLAPKRDYIYIDDLNEAIINALDRISGFNVFNIGSGQSYSVEEVIELIQYAEGSNISVRCVGERRPQEIMDTIADISRASEDLGWSPKWSLSNGIKAVVDAYKN